MTEDIGKSKEITFGEKEIKLTVTPAKDCKKCYGYKIDCKKIQAQMGECSPEERIDKISVIFKLEN